MTRSLEPAAPSWPHRCGIRSRANGPKRRATRLKQIFAHLLVGAVPALALGQGVNIVCPADSCHFAPYFRGEGGFVGERSPTHVNDRGEPLPVRFVLNCGRVTVSGEVEPDADGIVRQLLSGREGLACWGNGGTFELRGLRDGGWYWITDKRNSAVSSLLRLGARDSPETIPFDPGGVTITTSRNGAASFVKHEPTGRVGILPNILPMAVTPGCSGEAAEDEACVLGSPEEWSLALTTGAGDAPVGAEAIERGANGSVKVSLVGRNFVRTGTVATDISLSGGTRGETILSAPGEVTISGTPPDPAEGGEMAWTILVADEPDRCAATHPDRRLEQTVVVTASGALTGAIPAFAAGEGPSASFTVNCPDSG